MLLRAGHDSNPGPALFGLLPADSDPFRDIAEARAIG